MQADNYRTSDCLVQSSYGVTKPTAIWILAKSLSWAFENARVVFCTLLYQSRWSFDMQSLSYLTIYPGLWNTRIRTTILEILYLAVVEVISITSDTSNIFLKMTLNLSPFAFFPVLLFSAKCKCRLHIFVCTFFIDYITAGAIIGDGDRKSWDPRAPMIWDNFSIFRTNCAILTSYIRADPRTCRGLSRGCCHVPDLSQRWQGIRQEIRIRALICNFMRWASGKGEFFKVENKTFRVVNE